MKSPQSLHLKTITLIVIMVSVAPLSGVLLRKGMEHIPAMVPWPPSEVFRFFFQAFTSGTIWLGIGLQLAFFVAYLLALSCADYSYVQPVSAISYLIITVLARFVLQEVVSPLRWAGVIVICLGVFVVGHTPPRKTGHPPC
jgi:drug/metabolite transporter (DMT)-like permease